MLNTQLQNLLNNPLTPIQAYADSDLFSTQNVLSRLSHSVLWVVFAIMILSTVVIGILTTQQQKNNKLFHHITLTINFIAAISYYSMASGIGISLSHHGARPLFWARYLDWLLTTPLLLTDLGLLAGIPIQDIVLLVLSDVVMVVTGLLGAINQSESTKWGYFVMSCIFFVYVVYELATTARRTSYLKSSRVGFLFTAIAVYSMLLWTVYPVVWALSEGSSIISPDLEILFYAVLDVMAKAVFGFWLLIAHSIIPESNVIVSNSFTDPRIQNGVGYSAIAENEEAVRD
ncbi:uncharacterized protein MELLADRAFT_50312 [Melampsora larici-populina 98AG31]|uniref:Family A G protein-coupled receptor-like protein n=1 Tax=Melampsora larici-populina (strain 98AG31 / pathotype 3-4-7) TaxID=747676 RepID=F4S3M3_MELLP|nr:uncharacterized protein MELLADRAFT_50312 [Melampsora larici-populina 98AG31]EGG00698.1 hypothetical protein MELLADRAFT_50312 [Melampsora larici-populina 98AG31]